MIKKNGTTLIELVVVLAITAFLLITAIPAYNAARRGQELELAALEVANIINNTRQYSLAPRRDSSKNAAAYCFRFDANLNSWLIGEVESIETNESLICQTSEVVESGELSNYTYIKCTVCAAEFSTGINNAIDAGQPNINNKQKFTVIHKKTGETMSVTLSTNGVVNVE